MKEEKPILFGPDMVRAILDGKKTQTRRPIKQQPGRLQSVFGPGFDHENFFSLTVSGIKDVAQIKAPYYPGQKLWVRETFCKERGRIIYRASLDPDIIAKWTPSIFMPKSAARIWLEVTSVRAQRLEDLSYSECYKEGIEDKEHVTPWTQFFHIWRKMYGGGPYDPDENPWMWVIEFRRIKP